MRKFIFAAVALSAAVPAVAQNAPTRFEHEGVHYEYVVSQRADGARVIEGRNLNEQRKFSLIERNGVVKGSIGGSDVAFRVKKVSGETKGSRF